MYISRKTIVFHNGKFLNATDINVNPYSQTLHYGFGVIDGLRGYKTGHGVQIFKARNHYDRFLRTAQKLGIKLNYSTDELIHISYQLLEYNNLTDSYLRPIIYMGQNMGLTETTEYDLLITAWRWRNFSREPMRVMISDFVRPVHHRNLIDAKLTGNYYSTILATTDARSKGFQEALLKDTDGNISEGPGANVFFEKEGKLYTPSLGSIYPGITRTVVMKIAREMGIEVIEDKLPVEFIKKDIDSSFFTSTPFEIAGICSIDGKMLKKEWEKSLGFQIHQKYKNKVTLGEYDSYSII
jgi:branched-chain amino acid aminotransferase